MLHTCAMMFIFSMAFLSLYILAKTKLNIIISILLSIFGSFFIILALFNFDLKGYFDEVSGVISYFKFELIYPIFFGLFSILIAYILASRIKPQIYRSLFHTIMGVILALFLVIGGSVVLIAITGILIVLSFAEYVRIKENSALSEFVKNLLAPAFREGEAKGYLSGFFYLTGVFLIVLFLPEKIALTSLLILAFSDPAATIIGKRFGKTKWRTNPEKSVEGSLAMFSVSLIILFLAHLSYDLEVGILTLFFVAIAITITEALPLKIGDNILIPVLAGIGIMSGVGKVTPDIWFLLLILLGVLIYLFKMLNLLGTIVAMFFGLIVILSSTPQFLIGLIDFLALGFLISRFKYREKEKIGAAEANRAKRGINPVIANGIIPTFSALLYTVDPKLSILLFSGAISAALADVFATEIGVLDKSPLLLFKLKLKRVKPGTRGAISLYGEFGALVGSLIMGILLFILFSDHRLLFISILAGFFGCNTDSLIGSCLSTITKSEINIFATMLGALFTLIFY